MTAGTIPPGSGSTAKPPSTAVTAPENGRFRVVEQADDPLNGIENENRPPISLTLMASTDPSVSLTENELAKRYADVLRVQGWTVNARSAASGASALPSDWWTYNGRQDKDGAILRIGPASAFVAHGSVAEGDAPLKFGRAMKQHPEPLIVVSIEPA